MRTKRIRYPIAGGALVATLGAVAAAVALSSAAGPDSGADAVSDAEAAGQRVMIETDGVDGPGPGGFDLIPQESGALERDSGTESSVWNDRVVLRKGQRVVITKGVETLAGERGTLKLRFRIGWVEAGSGQHVGTGTWKVVRGTGQYAKVTGGGRSGGVWSERGPMPWSGRSDGFLAVQQ